MCVVVELVLVGVSSGRHCCGFGWVWLRREVMFSGKLAQKVDNGQKVLVFERILRGSELQAVHNPPHLSFALLLLPHPSSKNLNANTFPQDATSIRIAR